jgi:PAS domain S-box-containing protein
MNLTPGDSSNATNQRRMPASGDSPTPVPISPAIFHGSAVPPWQLAALFSVAFWALAEVSRKLSVSDSSYASFWLPTGFYMAVLLLNETRTWPWFILAALPANLVFDLSHGAPFATVLGFYCGNTVNAVAGAWLVRKFVAERPTLATLKEFTGLIGVSAGPATLLGAAIGAATLVWSGMSHSFFASWKTWWGNGSMAILLTVPFVLSWLGRPVAWSRFFNDRARLIEAALLVAGLAGCTWYMLVADSGIMAPYKSRLMPFLLWAALRFGIRGATAANLLLALLTSFLTVHFLKGLTPAQVADGDYVGVIQSFLAICIIMSVITAIVVGERDAHLSQLRESEERFRQLTVAAFEGIVVSENGKVLDANDQALKMFGYGRDEMMGRPITDMVAPEWRTRTMERIRAGDEAIYGHRLLRKDGSMFYGEAQAKIVHDGARVLRMTALRDITERRHVEALITNQNRVLELIASGAPLAQSLAAIAQMNESFDGEQLCSILLVDADGMRLRHGAAPSLPEAYCRAIDGERIGEGVGSCGTAIFRRETVIVEDIAIDPLWANYRELALAHGLRACWSAPIFDGQHRVLGAFAMYLPKPGRPAPQDLQLIEVSTKTAAIAICREKAADTLRQSEAKYRTLVERMGEGLLMVDNNDAIQFANEFFCEMVGYSTDDLMGRNASDLLLEPEERERMRKRNADRRQRISETYELHVRCRSGRRIWCRNTATPLYGADGEVIGSMAIITDITERLQLEQQVRQSQKLEAVGQLAGGVAHDFNNILAAMIMRADLALNIAHVPEEARGAFVDLRECAERAADLTRQLLAFGRQQVMQSRTLDLNEIISSLAKMLVRIVNENVQMEINLHPRPVFVRADAGMLDQVLMNLVINARDAMPTGGRLTIETGEKHVNEEEAQLITELAPGRYIHLSVSDTGSGIIPENLPKIFEPFFTTKALGKGTGLGLSTVFGIIKQHEGAIQVESESGRRTTFHIYLPAQNGEDAPATETSASPQEARFRGTETILVVEDDLTLRGATQSMLEHYGYRVLVALHGVEALRVWEHHNGPINLLLTDLVMPEGISGKELAARLRQLNPSLSIIFTSGYSADIAGRELTLQVGQNFIQKPSSPQEILKMVRHCLDHGDLPREKNKVI